eukprot:TRINITY_DN518_c0_g3_i1.p1 TRINITY_DN518_c0_g3~~TRINITY_DN518_c0_g3_i1.p1  ORF type:complete len:169 (-),score=36.00 TRINITY_DN518_c0_g3_i1:67-552(-)
MQLDIKTPKIFKSFKEFLSKTLTVELIVGLVIAASLQTIITSALNDIILPLTIGLLFGSNVENIFVVLKAGKNGTSYNTPQEANDDGALTLNFGIFLTKVLRFVVMILFLFLFIKGIGGLAKKVRWNDSLKNKQCSFCFKEVDIRAARCPFCTSNLDSREV